MFNQGMDWAPGDSESPTVAIGEDGIRQLADKHPIVHLCLTRFFRGDESYQRSLEWMVALLCDQSDAVDKVVLGLFQERPDFTEMAKKLLRENRLLRARLDEAFLDQQINLKEASLPDQA